MQDFGSLLGLVKAATTSLSASQSSTHDKPHARLLGASHGVGITIEVLQRDLAHKADAADGFQSIHGSMGPSSGWQDPAALSLQAFEAHGARPLESDDAVRRGYPLPSKATPLSEVAVGRNRRFGVLSLDRRSHRG